MRTYHPLQFGLAATIEGSNMYEKPKVRDYGNLAELTAVSSGEEINVKSVKVA